MADVEFGRAGTRHRKTSNRRRASPIFLTGRASMLPKFLKNTTLAAAVFAATAIAGVTAPAQATDTINFGTQPATMPIYIAKALGLIDEMKALIADLQGGPAATPEIDGR